MKQFFTALMLMIVSFSVHAEARSFSHEAYYHMCKSSTQDCQAFLANEIDKAKHSVVYPAQLMNSALLTEAILAAKKRGVATHMTGTQATGPSEFARAQNKKPHTITVIDKSKVYFTYHQNRQQRHKATSVIHVNDPFFASQVLSQVVTEPKIRNVDRQAATACRLIIPSKYNGNYEVYGAINGREVNFLVDTGATYVTVPSYLAKELNLKPHMTSRAQTATHRITAHITWIKELRIGPITLRNVKAAILPRSNNRKILLGMSALRKLDFMQQRNNLVLIQYTNNPTLAPCVLDASQVQSR